LGVLLALTATLPATSGSVIGVEARVVGVRGLLSDSVLDPVHKPFPI